MNKLLAFLSALLTCSGICSGQTNSALTPVELFSISAPRLRLPASELRQSSRQRAEDGSQGLRSPRTRADSENVLSSDSPAMHPITGLNQTELTSGAGRFDVQLFRRLEGGGYFTRPRSPSDNRIVRFIDDAFRPEVMHFRKVDLSCSLVTAIKRKNPLCLLNPVFFNLSW